MITGLDFTQVIILGISGATLLFALGYFIRKYAAERKVKLAEARAKEVLHAAGKEAQNIHREAKLEARDLLYRTRTEFEKETKETRQQLAVLEKRLLQKEENIDRKVDILDKKERGVQFRERNITSREKQLE
ncbi:unnamed protein product, partial [marine sediment metagenome]